MKSFCVLTTTKNNSKELYATYLSIKNQSLRDFEWIIYDGSTIEDDLIVIKKIVEQANANGIKSNFYHGIDASLYDAMNTAVSYVKSEHVLILNCGDLLYEKHTIEKILSVINSSKADIFHFQNYYVESSGNIVLQKGASAESVKQCIEKLEKPYFKLMVCQQAIVYRRNLLNEIKMDSNFIVAADHKLFIDAIQHNKKFEWHNFPISIYFAGGFSWKYSFNCVVDWFRLNVSYENIRYPSKLASKYIAIMKGYVA